MSGHSFYSPSGAHRWMNCPGSLAFPPNQVEGDSSDFADDGTASHNLGARALQSGEDCEYFLGTVSEINGKTYVNDEQRCSFTQVYVDDVRRRALGGILWVEVKVSLAKYLGEGQGGTADAAIIVPAKKLLVVEDLKYGMGEKVDASYTLPEMPDVRLPNQQLGLYALGVLADAELLDHEIERVLLVVCQPRLGHIDEFECSVKDLKILGAKAKAAMELAGEAMILPLTSPQLDQYIHPGEKTCRWCRVKATCRKLAKYVEDQVRADFDTIVAEEPVAPPSTDTIALARNMLAVPLIKQWCHAVEAATHQAVSDGLEVIGSDGKPYKFVEGDLGDRKWADPEAAEQLLLTTPGIGPEKAYTRKLLTAPAAAKILDKKKTKQTWNDVFVPLITRATGRPMLVLGSDPRPAYTDTSQATAGDFDEQA